MLPGGKTRAELSGPALPERATTTSEKASHDHGPQGESPDHDALDSTPAAS